MDFLKRKKENVREKANNKINLTWESIVYFVSKYKEHIKINPDNAIQLSYVTRYI